MNIQTSGKGVLLLNARHFESILISVTTGYIQFGRSDQMKIVFLLKSIIFITKHVLEFVTCSNKAPCRTCIPFYYFPPARDLAHIGSMMVWAWSAMVWVECVMPFGYLFASSGNKKCLVK